MSTTGRPRNPGSTALHPPEDLEPTVKRELKRLGARLRQARHDKGMSQEQAAEMMGLHAKYMPRLEGGRANPTVATLVAASLAYGVPLRDFFADDNGAA